MKTYVAKPGSIEAQWHLVDGTDLVLGRLAARLATILQGKHRPTYTPHVDTGDFVVVINAEKIRLTGRKNEQKVYRHYTGWPSGLREVPYEQLKERKPTEVLREAVRRMLPKSNLGRQMLSKLKIYAGTEHRHEAQKPQPLTID
ncbi:MAG: 50S ribosomal protein L13 [Planctomycetota bacterium]